MKRTRLIAALIAAIVLAGSLLWLERPSHVERPAAASEAESPVRTPALNAGVFLFPQALSEEARSIISLGQFLVDAEAAYAHLINSAIYEALAQAELDRQEAARQAAPRAARFVPSGGSGASGDWLDRLAQCECGGNPSCNTGNGYYGTFQFTLSTWRSVGGEGLPSDASYEEQKARAAELLTRASASSQFPGCTAKLGAP